MVGTWYSLENSSNFAVSLKIFIIKCDKSQATKREEIQDKRGKSLCLISPSLGHIKPKTHARAHTHTYAHPHAHALESVGSSSPDGSLKKSNPFVVMASPILDTAPLAWAQGMTCWRWYPLNTLRARKPGHTSHVPGSVPSSQPMLT